MGLISGLVVLGPLRDRFAFRGETLHVTADKFLQVRFTSHEEIIADACELW